MKIMDKLDLLKEYCSVMAYDRRVWMIVSDPDVNYILGELRDLVWLIEEGTEEDIKNNIEYKARDLSDIM